MDASYSNRRRSELLYRGHDLLLWVELHLSWAWRKSALTLDFPEGVRKLCCLLIAVLLGSMVTQRWSQQIACEDPCLSEKHRLAADELADLRTASRVTRWRLRCRPLLR